MRKQSWVLCLLLAAVFVSVNAACDGDTSCTSFDRQDRDLVRADSTVTTTVIKDCNAGTTTFSHDVNYDGRHGIVRTGQFGPTFAIY